jgi:hypothetical protein
MTEMLKYLGSSLHHYYSAIVQSPMPWRVIDKLATLEEVCEQKSSDDGDNSYQPDLSGPPDTLDRGDPPA